MHSRHLAMVGASVSDEADLLVSIPRPHWKIIRRVLVFGFSLMISLTAAFLVSNDLLSERGMTAAQRVLLLGLAGMFGFNALIKVWLLSLSLKLPLQIFKSGIAFQGVKMPWGTVEGCRWARYSPASLEIRFHRRRHYFIVPMDQRAAVEAALRDLGKWQC